MSYGGADLSTVDPNPSVDDYASTDSSTDWTGISNAVGQWGATIASIATGNPAPAPVYGGGYPATAVAGSGFASNKNSQLLVIGIIVVAAFLLLRNKP